MTAQSIDTFVLAFSDPALDEAEPQRARVNQNISFEIFDDSRTRTLSTNNGGGDIEGLLYVPDLDPSDPCVNISTQYIPNNVTRKAELPTTLYLYVAFAPWISAPCTKSYLAAAHGATAFMTYTPDNSTGTPPPISDPTWNLNDGGQWKSQSKFPVYAVPGVEGAAIMQQLAQYSGNLSSPKNQEILGQEQFEATDYVRLYTTFETKDGNNLPTLWAFLLIVLGIVLVLIGATSCTMHYFQHRNRRALQQRVENGEVDLETLGIKHQRVPLEDINSLPTMVYIPNEEKEQQPNQTPESSTEPCASTSSLPQQSSELSSATSAPTSSTANHTFWAQPTCPICLEDFVPHSTTVRSLPCHHIYHPSCIDPFLRNNSSLCPVCKAKVLPADTSTYSGERVTNAMVRRERHIRRLRQGREPGSLPGRPAVGEQGVDGRWVANFRRGLGVGRRVFSAPASSGPTTSQIEMGAVGTRAVSVPMGTPSNTTPPEAPAVDNAGRTERARRRASAFLRHDRTSDSEVYEEQQRLYRFPKLRKAIGSVFPGVL